LIFLQLLCNAKLIIMHIAIIMDGNGRWASQRGLPRTAGHRAGAKAVDEIVEAAARRGIGTLSLYAFSAGNWRRPQEEVGALFALLRRYLLTQTPRCLAQDIRINVIGRRDRLTPDMLRTVEHSERMTAECSGMRLRIAVDYSSQHSLLESCRRMALETSADRSRFLQHLAEVDHSMTAAPDVDLLIRTGGEKRLSDFLLWECAYAELYFVDSFWPDFGTAAFAQAVDEYAKRDRRFGQVGATRDGLRAVNRA
jgi:undecaprenyl diphosphate synthase